MRFRPGRFTRLAGRYFWSLLVITNLTFVVVGFLLWLVPDGQLARQLDLLLAGHGRELKFR
jgi:hypothetical protein